MHGVEFAPAPIEREQRLLILRGELRAVAKGHARRRAGADVEHRRQVVGIELRPLARSVSPAELGPADDMIDSRGAIPACVEVVFHVGVVGEQLAFAVDRRIEDVAKARRHRLELLTVRRDSIDDATRSHDIAHEAATVRHARQQMVLTPDRGDRRRRRHRGRLRPVAADEEQRFAIGCRHDSMDTVIAAGRDLAQQFDLVELIVTVTVAQPIQPAGDLLFVVIDSDVQRIERPHHAVHRADVGGNFLDALRIERLSRLRRGEAIQPAVLIADEDPLFVVDAQIHPRSLIGSGDRIQQLDLKVFERLDAVDWRRFVPFDRWPNDRRSIGLRRLGFGLSLLGGRRDFGQARQGEQK